MREAIKEWLDRLPEACDAGLYRQKCDQVYAHVYDNYFGDDKCSYTCLALAV